MNPIRKFIIRWLDPDGYPGQTMPDADYDAQAKWAASQNKMRPESNHRVEEWQEQERRR
jgi:hypothetical protein